VIQDRLGSVGKYYPYGEERNSPQLPNDQVKFATYTRDSATGNDYADQRYYTSVLGRFMTPDPYMATAKGAMNPTDPQSWNHYAYAGSDPANRNDPTGKDFCDDDTSFCFGTDFTDENGGLFGDALAAFFSDLAYQIAQAVQAAQALQQMTIVCDLQLFVQPAGSGSDP
jgi:RHS repeat-associated protein